MLIIIIKMNPTNPSSNVPKLSIRFVVLNPRLSKALSLGRLGENLNILLSNFDIGMKLKVAMFARNE
jgi:hypothetical protein